MLPVDSYIKFTTNIDDRNTIDFKENVTNFINMINTSNAASAIGTLEFMDQISKYNTTSLICKKNVDDIDLEKYNELYLTKGGKYTRKNRKIIKKSYYTRKY